MTTALLDIERRSKIRQHELREISGFQRYVIGGFRLYWMLRSLSWYFAKYISGQPVLTLEDWTERMSRNFGNQLPTDAA
jgi:hypothetical protein